MIKRSIIYLASTALIPAMFACSSSKSATRSDDGTRTTTTSADDQSTTGSDDRLTATDEPARTDTYATDTPASTTPGSSMQSTASGSTMPGGSMQGSTMQGSTTQGGTSADTTSAGSDRSNPSGAMGSTQDGYAQNDAGSMSAGTRAGASAGTGTSMDSDRSSTSGDMDITTTRESSATMLNDRATTLGMGDMKGTSSYAMLNGSGGRAETLTGVGAFSKRGTGSRLQIAIDGAKPGRYIVELADATCPAYSASTELSGDMSASQHGLHHETAVKADAAGSTNGLPSAGPSMNGPSGSRAGSNLSGQTPSGSADSASTHSNANSSGDLKNSGAETGIPPTTTAHEHATSTTLSSAFDASAKRTKLGTLTVNKNGQGKLNANLTKKQLGTSMSDRVLIIRDSSMTNVADGIVACGAVDEMDAAALTPAS